MKCVCETFRFEDLKATTNLGGWFLLSGWLVGCFHRSFTVGCLFWFWFDDLMNEKNEYDSENSNKNAFSAHHTEVSKESGSTVCITILVHGGKTSTNFIGILGLNDVLRISANHIY